MPDAPVSGEIGTIRPFPQAPQIWFSYEERDAFLSAAAKQGLNIAQWIRNTLWEAAALR